MLVVNQDYGWRPGYTLAVVNLLNHTKKDMALSLWLEKEE